MHLYSDYPAHRVRQGAADIAALLGIVAFIVLGVVVHGLIMALQSVGVRLSDAGSGFESTMRDISDRLGDVPVIGSGIRSPFDDASAAGTTLDEVGKAQQEAVAQLATGVGLALSVIPVIAILLLWLIPRIRFVRRSRWARVAAASPMGIDLLAHRALSLRRLPELLAIDSDAAGAWRRHDPQVVDALASLELRAAGVRPAAAAVRRGASTPLS